MSVTVIQDSGQQSPRWSRAHMVARETVRALQEAAAYAEKAHQITDDEAVARHCARARKELAEALRRAGVVLEHVDLTEVDQADLGLAPEGEA